MADPTITTTGTASGLLLITDKNNVTYRIPKGSLSNVIDSSNENCERIEIITANNEIVLLFGAPATKNQFIADLEALY